jgi:hypothetical protein
MIEIESLVTIASYVKPALIFLTLWTVITATLIIAHKAREETK